MTEEKQTKFNGDAFGITPEDADKVRTDILPAVPLGEVPVGGTIKLKILSEKPEKILHKQVDPKTQEETQVETPVLKVHNLESGMDETLWLSSISLRMEMFKLSKILDFKIKDKTIIIKVDEYEHKNKSFGMCRGYRAQVVREEAPVEEV